MGSVSTEPAVAPTYVDKIPGRCSTRCALCGTEIDPLRCPGVLALDDGLRGFCSPGCRDGLRAELTLGAERRPTISLSASQKAARRQDQEVARTAWPLPDLKIFNSRIPSPPWVPMTVCLIAAICALTLSSDWTPGAIVALSASSMLGPALQGRLNPGGSPGMLDPFVGAGLLALALAAILSGPDTGILLALPFGCALVIMRPWLVRMGNAGLGDLMSDLREQLPERTRVSNSQSPGPGTDSSEERKVADVRAGEEVVCEAGSIVPVDGVVQAGEAQLLPHRLARVPIDRAQGDSLIAGARVVKGALRIRATRVGDQRAMARLDLLAEPLETGLSPLQEQAERLCGRGVRVLYTVLAPTLALISQQSLNAVLAALGLAALLWPGRNLRAASRLPYLAAGTAAAARGIFYRGASTIERAGATATATFCLEGTLTTGAHRLLETCPVDGESDNRALLKLAMGAQQAALPHPIAQAFQRHGQDRRIEPANLRRGIYLRGQGVTATLPSGGSLVMGSRALLLGRGIGVALADADARHAEDRGNTTVFLALDGRVRAVFCLSNELRPDARAAVQSVIDGGPEVAVLSGNHMTTVASLARDVDIQHVKAELNEAERGEEVRRLRAEDGPVTVVGQLPQDSTALGLADVSLVLDAAGSASNVGDVVLATSDLKDAADSLLMAQAARRTVRVNVALSAVAVGGLTLLSAAGLMPMGLAPLLMLAVDWRVLPTPSRLAEHLMANSGT